jgi:hypothetical protein
LRAQQSAQNKKINVVRGIALLTVRSRPRAKGRATEFEVAAGQTRDVHAFVLAEQLAELLENGKAQAADPPIERA